MESTVATPLANFYGKKMFLASYKVDGESRSFTTEIHFVFNSDGTLIYFDEEEYLKGSWNCKPENYELVISCDGTSEKTFTIEDVQKSKLKMFMGNEETILYVKSEKNQFRLKLVQSKTKIIPLKSNKKRNIDR